jgi:hypothetical protein
MLSEIHHSEATRAKPLHKMIDILDVSLMGIDEPLLRKN